MRVALRSILFALALVLQAAAPKPFKIIEAGIHQTEDGALSPAGTIFVPGEVIFFSCRLDGYAVSPEKKVAIRYEFSAVDPGGRSEEHTSELQSRLHLVCRLLLEKKKHKTNKT